MKIHEYHAREIFQGAGIPVPKAEVARTPEEVLRAAERIGKPVVIKAQVLVGGRGKAGGVKIAKNPQEAKKLGSRILGMEIKGLRVDRVLVAEAVAIEKEVYLGVLIDRSRKRPLVMASASGGIEIEEVAKQSPEAIHKLVVDPLFGILPFQCRALASRVIGDFDLSRKIADIIRNLYGVFQRADASLAEINPLVVTPSHEVLAIDAKINVDDNALFRQGEIEKMRDLSSEDPGEAEARARGLSFVRLEGEVGCIVNGAGLAMATMDLVKACGSEPANFLDIGGSSNPEKVLTAMRIISRDPKVRSIFINIFGGITRCDDVARGIVTAFNQLDLALPVVVRLTGTNEDEARRILDDVELHTASSMDEGVQKAIELARKD